ncbi:hypothetical protein P152DRAFT_4921 [Eremomyces bilateralis CBS 781.70]|uniref:Uncharacterized protein n=1 Tax=Eremomyces bilateralis CBS 781.70 TaxID=1392243 RepID=A0A6G1GFS6_9PEZI|nr:uncharacterized protein P152DRAFT_4921 [Eremomyces bilateralis CBS 781.70]KAF1816955.1 hypothetical protein P152DRAFT_4921 [Eremomyces bilateralis CBS 781.70]
MRRIWEANQPRRGWKRSVTSVSKSKNLCALQGPSLSVTNNGWRRLSERASASARSHVIDLLALFHALFHASLCVFPIPTDLDPGEMSDPTPLFFELNLQSLCRGCSTRGCRVDTRSNSRCFVIEPDIISPNL